MEAIIPLSFVLLIVFAAAVMRWNYFRAEHILKSWARNNDYKILSAEFRWFRRGPFLIAFLWHPSEVGGFRNGLSGLFRKPARSFLV